MNASILYVGIACVIAAIVGGGFRWIGMDVPELASFRRQLTLGVFGLLLIGANQSDKIAGVIKIEKPSGTAQSATATTPNLTTPVSQPAKPLPAPQPMGKGTQSEPPLHQAVEPAQHPLPGNSQFFSDLETGYMWLTITYYYPTSEQDADDYCRNLEYGNFRNWELPTYEKLHELMAYSGSYGYIADKYLHLPSYLWIRPNKFVASLPPYTIFDVERGFPTLETYHHASPGALCVRTINPK